jgi:2-polyprenyl-6-methoxyphenol hydroxylase-like FAD-dependent oxidoreductase
MKVLVSGAGIAGPTLAYWLARYGMEPTLVEKAPRLRTDGYVIDFWGAGFEVAERMGLLPAIREKGYVVQEVRVVDGQGRRAAGFPADVFGRLAGGRYVSLPRGDLAALIFGALGGHTETIFGNRVVGLERDGRAVHVQFASGAEREFDLVVGADGLHSRVREVAFGPQRSFEKFLGYRVAAFEVEGYRPRDELVYVMYTEVGQQVARFTMRQDRTLFLFIYADPDPEGAEGRGLAEQKAALRTRFGRSAWECRRILEALDGVDELYFDRVSQIRMGPVPGAWTRGRVTLLGDAAFCVSFLAGQGSALAMTAAYLLAAELSRAGDDVAGALTRYERTFSPFVRAKQDAALRLAGAFAPKSKLSMFVRNQIMSLLHVTWIAEFAFGSELRDRLALPEA